MLNDYQVMVVRHAIAMTQDVNAEIAKLAKGMRVSENTIRKVLGMSSVSSTPPPTSCAKEEKTLVKKSLWTPDQVAQLLKLADEGKGSTEIAKIMGLDKKRVSNKLLRERKESQPDSNTPMEKPPQKPLDAPEPPKKEIAEETTFTASKDIFGSVIPSAPRLMNLAAEIMNLIKYLEYSFPPVEMGLLEANQSAGWAMCHFKAAGQEYTISLNRVEEGIEE